MTRTIIIPYFNEERRFPVSDFVENVKRLKNINLILVDDGSTDNLTSKIFNTIKKQKIENVTIIKKECNLGKAAALQTGFLYGISINSKEIGFLDADFSTSLEELINLFEILESTNAEAVIGSRQLNPQSFIKGRIHRMILGRIFSKIIRHYFQINLFDTQCGAKVFKVNKVLKNSLKQPIINPWLYDLQLLLPILKFSGTVKEVALKEWIHKNDSKFNIYEGFLAVIKIKKLKIALETFNTSDNNDY